MKGWKIGDSIGLRLDQMSDEEIQTPEQVEAMIQEINQVVAKHGFKVRQSGAWTNILKWAVGEKEYIKQIKAKVIRDLKEANPPALGVNASETIAMKDRFG